MSIKTMIKGHVQYDIFTGKASYEVRVTDTRNGRNYSRNFGDYTKAVDFLIKLIG